MLTPADLFEVRKIVVAASLLSSGEFDKEIKRLEVAAQQTVDVASAEASKIRAQADTYLDTVNTQAKAILEAVDKAKDSLQEDRDKFAVAQSQADVQAQENQDRLRDDRQALAAERAAHEAQVAELTPRLAEVARKESNLDIQLSRVADLQAELNDKLVRLRAVAA